MLPADDDLRSGEELALHIEAKSEPDGVVDCEPSVYFDALLRRLRVAANVENVEDKTLLETAVGYADSAAIASILIERSHGVTACSPFADDETTVREVRPDLDQLDQFDSYIAIRHEHPQAEYLWIVAARDNLLLSWESSAPTRRPDGQTLESDLDYLIALILDDLAAWRTATSQCLTDFTATDSGEVAGDCVGIDNWIETVQT